MNGAIVQLITGMSLLGLLIGRRGVAEAAARSAVAARLRTLYTLLGALLVLRLLTPLIAAAPLVVALMIVAAWLPFAGVRLVEELCRRHAPRSMKILALGGAVAFTLTALTFGLVWSTGPLLALAGYQTFMLAAMIWLLARERDELAPAERQTADTFLLALLLAIPMAASDFSILFPDLPVRGGALAVLVLVLATSKLVIDRGTPMRLLADLVMLLGAGGATALMGVLALPVLARESAVALAAGGAAVGALLLLIDRSAARASAGSGLIAALAGAPADDQGAMLSAHPLLTNGRILQGGDLGDHPPASLARLLEHRVISGSIGDAETRDARRDLLDATRATHLLRISRDPPRLLAVAAGGLAGRILDDELELAARLIEKAP